MNGYDLGVDYDISELEEAAAKSPRLMELSELYGLDPWDIGFQMLQLETKEDVIRE